MEETRHTQVALLSDEERAGLIDLKKQRSALKERSAELVKKHQELTSENRQLMYVHEKTPEQTERVEAITQEMGEIEEENNRVTRDYNSLEEAIAKLETLIMLEKKIGDFEHFLFIGERLAKVAPGVIGPILRAAMAAAMDMGDVIEPEMQRGRVADAKRLHAKYQAFLDTGFSEEQAMKLLLAGIKPVTFAEQASMTAVAGGNIVQEGVKVKGVLGRL